MKRRHSGGYPLSPAKKRKKRELFQPNEANSAVGLLALPDDILLEIFTEWANPELYELQLVSRKLFNIVWKHLVKKLSFSTGQTTNKILKLTKRASNCRAIKFHQAKITNKGLHRLCLPHPNLLQHLQLVDLKIGDVGLECLKHFSNLRDLYIAKCPKITDQGLKPLQHLTCIENLSLPSEITNEGLVHIKSLVNLKYLFLGDCKIDKDGFPLLYQFAKANIDLGDSDLDKFRFYKTLAKTENNLYAQNRVGYFYQNGLGGVKQDYSKALLYYTMSATQGYGLAYNSIGWFHQNGYSIPKNDSKAAKWYRKSAEAGDHNGQNNLGFMYQHGRGVEKNYDLAIYYFQKSADAGNANAVNNLGFMYQNGFGVVKDIQRAKMYYKKASEAGNTSADENLRYLRQLQGSGSTDSDSDLELTHSL